MSPDYGTENVAALIVLRWTYRASSRHDIRKDLFGMFDVVEIRSDCPGMLGVQCTSRANVIAQLMKMQASPNLGVWYAAGLEAVVHGWSLKGARCKHRTWQ